MEALLTSDIPAWKSAGVRPRITEDVEKAARGEFEKKDAGSDTKISPTHSESI